MGFAHPVLLSRNLIKVTVFFLIELEFSDGVGFSYGVWLEAFEVVKRPRQRFIVPAENQRVRVLLQVFGYHF